MNATIIFRPPDLTGAVFVQAWHVPDGRGQHWPVILSAVLEDGLPAGIGTAATERRALRRKRRRRP